MSISNLDYTSYNFLSNLAVVNANEVNTDVLTKSDPDITDLQFDMLEGINTNETIQEQIDNVTVDVTALEADVLTLQGQMTTANSNISTLQGQMTTANSNISTLQGQMTTANSNISTLQGQVSTLDGEVNTLQSEMNTAQSDINTLQSEMNTAQADIGVLYGVTATNTAAITGLSISQASQDVIITSHTGSIATLQGEMTTAQGQITILQTKTTDQSWGALTGTTFSRRVYILNTGVGVGTYSVYLGSSEASTFLYGLTATGLISTAGTLTSTSGTSQVSSLLVNNNFEVTNSSFFGDTIYVDRAVLTSAKKVVLYDNSTGNDYDYLGFWTDSGTASKKFLNAEIDGVAGSAFQWYYGNNLGSSRTLAKSLSSADEINYTPKATFLKSAGASQQIQLVRDTANNRVRIDMIGDIAGANTFDGQIIQQEGNGVDDNRGIMTIQSGDVTLTAQTSATTGTLQMNAKVLDVNASGAITIDGATTTTITSVDDLTIRTTNPFGDLILTSAGPTTLTSTGQTQINSAVLDINASGAITIDGATTTTLTSVGQTTINSAALDINASGAITIDGASTTIITSIDDLTIQTTNPFGDILVTSAGTNTLTSVGQTQINSAVLDINASGAITIDGATTTFMKTANNFNIETTNVSADITFTSSGGFGVDSVGPVNIVTTTNTLFLGSLVGGISQQAEGSIEILSNNNFVTLDSGPSSAVNIGAGTNVNLTAVATVKSDCADFDVNATGAVTIDGATIGITGTNTILGVTNINETGVANTKIGNTTGTLQLKGSGIGLSGSTLINDASTASTSIGNTSATLQLKGSTNTITGVTNINHLNTLATTIGNTTGILTLRGATIINTTGTANTTIGNTTGTLTLTGATTDLNTDLRITQTTYTQPMASAFQLGYTNTASGSAVMTVTLAQRATFTLPQKGVWLIVLGYQWTGGASTTVTKKQAVISATTASSTPAAPGLQYYEEIDTGVTAALQQQGTIMGVYTATASTALFLNASANVSASTFPTLAWSISWTRIG